jgi:hypothetical protein
MTVAYLAPALRLKSWLNNGQPNAFGSVFTYAAGTVIPAATYTDNTGSVANTNPIQLNQRGEASVWQLPNIALKYIEFDANGNQIGSTDQVINQQLLSLNGGTDTGSSILYLLNFLSPYTSYSQFAGTPIFFVPSNNNAQSPSINVNGIGVVGLFNANGTSLGPNQIQANFITEIVYQANIGTSGNSGFVLLQSGSLTGSIVGTFGQEVPIASATTTDLGTLPAHVGLVTGTTTITSLGNAASLLAPFYLLRFSGSLTLTNSASLALPGSANIITQPGDALLAQFLGSSAWKVTAYFAATGAGTGNAKIKPSDTVISNSTALTPDPDLQSNQLAVGRYSWEIFLIFDSVTAGDGFKWTNDGTAVDSRGAAPALAYGFVNGSAYGPKAETPYATTITYGTVGTGASSNEVMYKGSLLVSTPGNFGISWAQASATAAATTLRAGSYLTVNLLNTGTASGVTTRVYVTPGTFTETVPTGFSTVTIECWGGSGGGGARFISGSIIAGGGGGSSGSYSRSTYSVAGLGGDTLSFTVGVAGVAAGINGGQSSVSSGTMAITTLTSPGGLTGANATAGNAPGAGGAAPANATGGTVVNTPGNAGGAGINNAGGGDGGVGAFGIPGIFDGGNAGGNGAGVVIVSTAGGVGIVVFSYS